MNFFVNMIASYYTMISKEEIKKLADLARIEIEESELEKIAQDVGPVLEYVSQVNDVAGSLPPLNDKRGPGGDIKVMREDTNPNESGQYTEALLAEAPVVQDGFVKVKKIL